ncbi:hypothetical protein FEE95_01980 [Maribacter algarum]|uniref:Polysaccharide lyase n=1 Tax=Maribacter algarum (ex Zhang et al. 2020) TaxID=2578118 RepID=A0A5S3PT95_9FLAO|nr:heparin lyase I family protein [Maribacter algarum]TMM58219.1 hypothetical protein FEE95_01980 [Maribacter algarum]
MNLQAFRTRLPMHFICTFIAIFLFNFSCSKDADTLSAKTVKEETVSLIEQDGTTNEEQEENISKEDSDDEGVAETGDCATSGGMANDSGLKTWCWGDIDVPSGASTGRDSFSNGQLALNIQCNANQVYKEGNRLRFVLNPTKPSPASWCPENFNMRSEIRTMPWNVDHPSGTEEWIGFSYGFGDNYIPDPTNNWVFYQAHEGTLGASPLLSLQIDGRAGSSYKTGEIVVVNASQDGSKNSIYGTNIVPTAGETVDVVLHVIWGDENTGLLEVWLNGNKLVDLQTTRTVRSSTRVGGNSKFGIYKHAWRSETGVQTSAAQGVSEVETFMGPLRIITRKPSDTNYRQNAYDKVSPE